MSRFLVSGRRARGFTLIESMAAMTVLGIMASIASYLILDNVDQCMAVTTAAQIHAELSVALDRATRELRKVRLEVDGQPAPDFSSVTATLLQWNDASGTCALTYSGGALTLAMSGGSAATLLTNVSACTMSVYDEDNVLLSPPLNDAACDDIRRVMLSVTVTRNGVSESLRTKALVRATMEGDA